MRKSGSGTSGNRHARDAQETYAYTVEEINSMISLFPEPAATAFAIAAFAGLRRSEIEGLDWLDFHDGSLWVSRSIWNGRELPAKNKKARSSGSCNSTTRRKARSRTVAVWKPAKRPNLRHELGDSSLD